MKQSELAERLGISQNQISRYENSSMNPTLETVIQMAELFDTTTDYLLGITHQPTKSPPDQLTEREVALLALFRAQGEDEQARALRVLRAMWERE